MSSSLTAINRPDLLSDRVYVTLREHVCSGQLPGGQALQETGLASKLGVSRTPVREALGRLASEGLLDSEGRSFVVPLLSARDIDDIYEVRLLLELAAVRQVCARISDRKQLRPLRDELATMLAAHNANDVHAFMNANYRFRSIWLGLVPNRRLLRAIELYADHVRYLRALTLGDKETRCIVMGGLRRLATALSAGNSDNAAAAMQQHLLAAKRTLRSALLQQSQNGERL